MSPETRAGSREPKVPSSAVDDCECRARYGPDQDGTFPARAMCPRAKECARRERGGST